MDNVPQKVELRTLAVGAGDAIAHARSQALLQGVRLSALCGNVWPLRDDGLGQLVADEIIAELVAFAINARRYLELVDQKTLKADGPILKIDLPDYRYEANIWTAVNRIVHASELRVVSVERAQQTAPKHDNLGDLQVACVQVTSPQRDTVAVCPQGLFYGFAAFRAQ